MTAKNPPIELLERSRWKDRDRFARLVDASVVKLRKRRQLEISDQHVPAFINKIADHLAETTEPDAGFLLQAYQPSRETKKQKRPSSYGELLRGNAKLWKRLVASEQQARIEICVYVKGGKSPHILFFEPISADSEFANMIEQEFFP